MSTKTTLLDLAKANAADPVVGLIEETIGASPEVANVPARTIKGTMYKTQVRTALPAAGFRNANEGVALSKSTFENRLVETFIVNPRWICDKAIADRYEDGPEAFIAMEADGQMRAALKTLGAQFYYGAGTGGDAKGHPGLIDAYDATNMVVDATGAAAGTGSSVWAVKFGPKDVQWVWGENGQLEMADPRETDATDDNGNSYTAYVQELLAYAGLQVGSKYAVGRIKKLTAENGKTLTDALLAQLLGKFPVGFMPDAFFMSRRSLMQLQASRTAYSPTGTPAPIPVEAFNIPIIATDNISDTEDLSL